MYSQLLQSVLLPAYDVVRGRRYTQRRKFLEASQWWTTEQIRDFQWTELRALLAHVFSSVPYLRAKYRAAGLGLDDIRSWQDFRRLPPLTRAEVNAHRAELCSTTYRGKLVPHATGGSTGTPTRFFRTYESYDWRTAAKDRVYGWSGWRLGQRSLYLWGAPVGAVPALARKKTRLFESVHRQLVVNTFLQGDELWRDVHSASLSFRPTVIVGYVSSLEQFAHFVRRAGLRPPPVRAIIAAAEPLHGDTRRTIESILAAPVFETYGSREFMSVAGECAESHRLHVNAENLVVETLEARTDQPSEILVTDLHNWGMPFVRYATGDLGTFSDTPCPCGRGLPALATIEGRVLDSLRTADGRLVPGEFFPHMLKEIPELTQYRVEQTRADHFVISAVLSAPLSTRSRSLLDEEIGKVFGSTTWEMRRVDSIPPLPSGKRRITVGLAS